jgi:hypothetical protein
MAHILLERAFNYIKRKEIKPPLGFYYDRMAGAWLSRVDSTLLINTTGFPQISTKKQDIETGEDQKGQ